MYYSKIKLRCNKKRNNDVVKFHTGNLPRSAQSHAEMNIMITLGMSVLIILVEKLN